MKHIGINGILGTNTKIGYEDEIKIRACGGYLEDLEMNEDLIQ